MQQPGLEREQDNTGSRKPEDSSFYVTRWTFLRVNYINMFKELLGKDALSGNTK